MVFNNIIIQFGYHVGNSTYSSVGLQYPITYTTCVRLVTSSVGAGNYYTNSGSLSARGYVAICGGESAVTLVGFNTSTYFDVYWISIGY